MKIIKFNSTEFNVLTCTKPTLLKQGRVDEIVIFAVKGTS